MSLASINFDNLFGFLGDIGKVAKDVREAITGKTITDPAKMAELVNKASEIEIKATEVSNSLMTAQTEINKEEAKSKSKFIAGWRPFVGWVCGIAFCLHFLIFPIADVIIKLIRVEFEFPAFDIMVLVNVLMGMLGLGIYRSLEKKWGVQDQH